jgi:hypothetical protein
MYAGFVALGHPDMLLYGASPSGTHVAGCGRLADRDDRVMHQSPRDRLLVRDILWLFGVHVEQFIEDARQYLL